MADNDQNPIQDGAPEVPALPEMPALPEAPAVPGLTTTAGFDEGVEEPVQEIEPSAAPKLPEAAYHVTDPLQLIPIGAAEHYMLEITYTNRKGETKNYTVEPYEIKNGLFYGYDVNSDTIKSFFLSNLSQIVMIPYMFTPRY